MLFAYFLAVFDGKIKESFLFCRKNDEGYIGDNDPGQQPGQSASVFSCMQGEVLPGWNGRRRSMRLGRCV